MKEVETMYKMNKIQQAEKYLDERCLSMDDDSDCEEEEVV